MIINHNLNALKIALQNQIQHRAINENLTKIATGKRINHAKDDPVGLMVTEKMRAYVRGMKMAKQNIQSGISLLQTAEGWLSQSNEILQRMRELAVQTANGIYNKEDRGQVQTEINELSDEINRISQQAEFNRIKILSGGMEQQTSSNSTNQKQNIIPEKNNQTQTQQNEENGQTLTLHIGPNTNQTMQITLSNMSANTLGLNSGEKSNLDYATQEGSNKAIEMLDNAFQKLNLQQAKIGSYQNRLENSLTANEVAMENIQASESQIRDADMARESIAYLKNKILADSSMLLLSQVNTHPRIALKLLSSL